MTPQDAVEKMARAYRVMFDEDPDEFASVMIDLASDRVARGDFFSWEVTPGKVRRLTFSKESAQGEIVPIVTPVADLLEEEAENEVSVRLPQITVEARRLNKKQQDFAVMIAQGLPIARAYALAGYGTTNTASAQAAGSRLANRDYMAAYIRSLKEAIYEKDAMTIKEAKSKLSQIGRFKPSDANEDSEFVGVKIHPDGTKTLEGPKPADKINAIEKLAKLSGWISDADGKSNVLSINILNERIKIQDGQVVADIGAVMETPVIEQ